jgi:hypothetical protein
VSLFIVDVEADGPCPGLYSMTQLGIVLFDTHPPVTFHAHLRPITDRWVPEALEVCKVTREETMAYPNAEDAMRGMRNWLNLNSRGRPVFVSDNPAFDWQFVNYYCHLYLGSNPFGFSARRIGDFAAGLERNFFAAQHWKRLRRTPHTHNPVDDALGNAEALKVLMGYCQ